MLGAHFRPSALLAPAALVVVLVPAPMAVAACGGAMTLGALNSCDAGTRVTGSFNGNLFEVTNTSTAAAATAIRGTANSGAAALRGINNGGGSGVQGTGNNGSGVTGASTNGIGVNGTHSATTGIDPGVRGQSSSTAANAAGIFGRLTSTAPGLGSAAVRGQNAGTNGNGSGVLGSHAGSGIGVLGTSVDGVGTQGDTSSTAGGVFGVLGRVMATSPGGFSAGVRGINNGTGGLGIGVWGSHDGAGWGVYGESPSGNGVRGESESGNGVAALSNGSAPALAAVNGGGGPAASFHSTGAPFTVSSSTKVANLNADQLDGRTADEFGRTAVAAVISYSAADPTFEEQASIVIDAPRDGLMLVSGAVSITTLLGGDTSCDPCLGVMRLRDVGNDVTSAEQVATFGDGSAEAATQLATSWVFPVEAGRLTFALDTFTSGADGDIFSDNPTLTALFVPFGPSGQAATAAVATRTSQELRR